MAAGMKYLVRVKSESIVREFNDVSITKKFFRSVLSLFTDPNANEEREGIKAG